MFIKHSSVKTILSGLTIFIAITHQELQANECDYYKERIEYYQHLRSMGGNADEMNRWTAIGHELDDKLYHCSRDTTINPTVQTVSGDESAPSMKITRRGHMALRSSSSNDSQLQQLIKTCNYWIDMSNEDLTQDNINFRDTACHAVDRYQGESENPNSPTQTLAVRKLKDCIKPNNLIDSDVNQCVQGNLEPTWRKK